MLADFATAESENPSPRKVIDESHIIYCSRRFRRPTGGNYGLPVLCDFGEARRGKTQESGPFVQPHIYRAPEVIFEMPLGRRYRYLEPCWPCKSDAMSVRAAACLADNQSDLGSVRRTASIWRYIRLQRWP